MCRWIDWIASHWDDICNITQDFIDALRNLG